MRSARSRGLAQGGPFQNNQCPFISKFTDIGRADGLCIGASTSDCLGQRRAETAHNTPKLQRAWGLELSQLCGQWGAGTDAEGTGRCLRPQPPGGPTERGQLRTCRTPTPH